MGAGKTAVGRELARKLRRPFTDLDGRIVEEIGMPIPEIFALHGEAYFRAKELAALKAVITEPPRIVATGGGIVTAGQARRLMRRSGTVVWLRAELETIRKRVGQGKERPLWKKETLKDLYEARLPLYKDCHFSVATDGRSPREVARLIGSYLEASIKIEAPPKRGT